MRHIANMSIRDLICSGCSIQPSMMSPADLEWAAKHSEVIKQDSRGNFYHSKITERDRQYRRNYWKPDTFNRHANGL